MGKRSRDEDLPAQSKRSKPEVEPAQVQSARKRPAESEAVHGSVKRVREGDREFIETKNARVEVRSDFDPRDVPLDASIVLPASRRSGKSTWLKDYLFWRQGDYDIVYVFTETKTANLFYNAFVPDEFIYEGWDSAQLLSILTVAREAKRKHLSGESKQAPPRILIILDDVIDEKLHNDPFLKKAFALGRHLNISIITSIQHINVYGPLIRSNADVVVLFKTQSLNVMQLIHENFMGVTAAGRAETARIVDALTEDWNVLMIVKQNNKYHFYQYKAMHEMKDCPCMQEYLPSEQAELMKGCQGRFCEECIPKFRTCNPKYWKKQDMPEFIEPSDMGWWDRLKHEARTRLKIHL